jgi:hypothetical protein
LNKTYNNKRVVVGINVSRRRLLGWSRARAPEADHRGRTMPAKFPGHCRECGGTIEVGDRIRFYPAGGGRQAEVAHGV